MAGLAALSTGQTFAQDEGGLRVRLGLQQTFAAGDNLALGVPGSATNPEQGRTTSATTSVAIQLDSTTRTQSLSLLLGGSLRAADLPAGSNTDTGFVDPVAEFSYSRQGADAVFTFSADYTETGISQPRPLWDFSDEDNIVTPPADLARLQGTGNRTEYGARVFLETGLSAPIGLRLNASTREVKYSNTTVAGLNDFRRDNVGLSTLFRFGGGTTGVIDLGLSRFEDNTGAPARDTRSLEVGVDQELASGAIFSARIGQTEADRNPASGGGSTRGTTGRLSWTQPMPDGDFQASYALNRTASGNVETLRFGRGYELPTGRLRVELGASSINGSSPKVVGGLNWQHQMPTSSITLSLNRAVLADANDESRFTTSLAARFSHDINATSNLFANVSYYVADGSTTANKVERGNLSLGYQYALTENWNLDTGFSYRMRDEATVGRAESKQIFVSLSRAFELF